MNPSLAPLLTNPSMYPQEESERCPDAMEKEEYEFQTISVDEVFGFLTDVGDFTMFFGILGAVLLIIFITWRTIK